MSQSLGNYVSIVDMPNDMFGKTMSIPDELILDWFELCTDVPMEEVRAMLTEDKNPRDAKVRLAKEIVALYHSPEAAQQAENYFVETFSKGNQPVEAVEAEIPTDQINDLRRVGVAALISALELAKSNGEARRLMQAGAVSLDTERLTDPFLSLPVDQMRGKILRVGRHQFRKLR